MVQAIKGYGFITPDDRGPDVFVRVGAVRKAGYSIDPKHVYVGGLSAGGAAAAIVGATHADLYATVGIHSGLACGAASDLPSAFVAMRQGAGPKQ